MMHMLSDSTKFNDSQQHYIMYSKHKFPSCTMKPVLVVGAGIAGMQTSLDLADQGIKVFLVEKNPSIGGRMSQLDKTFPTLDCSSCILTPVMVDVGRHENIELMTYSEVESISGTEGEFTALVRKKPRYVNMEKCTGCNICVLKCPYKVDSEFDMSMGKRKVIYIPFPQAIPLVPTIDAKSCKFLEDGKCGVCKKHCPTEAIEFEQKEEMVELNLGAIIYTTGFNLYDPSGEQDYGYAIHEDVITNMEFERLISSTGPNQGHLKRPSNGEVPKKVGIILCVGSRSQLEQHNWYCSRFCCMISIKQAILIKDHYPDTDVSIFYMDIRAFGKGFQEFYERAKYEYDINFIKGKVGKVSNGKGNFLNIRYENVLINKIVEDEFDMIVLAVGTETANKQYPVPLELADDGFISVRDIHIDPVTTNIDGILVAGSSEGPKDIPDTVIQASAAAMRASVILKGD